LIYFVFVPTSIFKKYNYVTASENNMNYNVNSKNTVW